MAERLELMKEYSDFTTDNYFIDQARIKSLESPCFKSKVGSIIVRHNKIISDGINISPPNQKNCAQIGFCYRIANNIQSGTRLNECRAFGCHAEQNAINKAAKDGISTDWATMYIYGNTEICTACRSSLTRAGIRRVVYMSKFGEMEKIDVWYEWNINPLDQKRKFEEWKENIDKN